MIFLNLELLALPSENYTQPEVVELNVSSYVHKRIERFVYSPKVTTDATPISYLESKKVTAKDNLQIVNKAENITGNNKEYINFQHIYTTSKNIRLPYKKILATDKTYVDSNSKNIPLFYKHQLPENTRSCQIEIIVNGNSLFDNEGFLIDLDAGYVYTNYDNIFDKSTRDYKLFFVYGTSDIGGFRHLLNLKSSINEAGWEDIDQDTGDIKEGTAVYTKEEGTYDCLYSFNTNQGVYVKPDVNEYIAIKGVENESITNNWFLRFGNGSFQSLINNKLRGYSLPEYLNQSYYPYYPIRYSSYKNLEFINSKLLYSSVKKLKIEPNNNLNLEIRIYNYDGILIKVLTTNAALFKTRYRDTEAFYEDSINSWDSKNGLVSLNINIDPSWSFDSSFFYESNDFEYTKINLNPVLNKDILKYTVVFYLIPDTSSTALHHLLVNNDGKIVYISQSLGIDYPNLQLLNSDNTYNINTIIDYYYASDINNDFLKSYCAGYDNNYGYIIIAEVNFIDKSIKENTLEFSLRRNGNSLESLKMNKTLLKNPKLLQSIYGFGIEGQELPFNGSGIIEMSLNLLEEYGGSMTRKEAEALAKTHYPAYNAAVIQWIYPKVELTGTSVEANVVSLTWTWEGPDYTYLLYKKNNYSDVWSFVQSFDSMINVQFTHLDSTSVANETCYYAVAIRDNNGITYPMSNSVCIKVA